MKFVNNKLNKKKALWVSLCLALTTMVSAAQTTASLSTNEQVIKAMTDEMRRSMLELRLSTLDRPYFIQYIVLEEEEFAARATFGALTSSSPTKQRLIYTQVRVGSYDFDNTEFAAGGAGGGGGGGGGGGSGLYQGTIDDDYDSLRRTLWLGTDAAYKSAVEVIAQKRSAIQNRTQDDQPVPDFSKEEPTVAIAERGKLEFDRAKIETQLRQW
jgi:hypothetical protein